MYPIPAQTHRTKDIIKRSEFITTLAHVKTADEANTFIATIKKEFPDASHNCWAYVAGKPADTARIGMSDDGEPHGTAGKPMLNVLLHSDVGEVAAVVTRYFGGTKLGTGGLVKAYSNAVKNALESLPLTEKQFMSALQLQFAYPYIDSIKHLIDTHNGVLLHENYAAEIAIDIEIPQNQHVDFVQEATNLCAGEITINSTSE